MEYSKYKVIFFEFEEDAIPQSEIVYCISGYEESLIKSKYPDCVIVSITKLY